jgi:hypothetical protein
MEYRIAHGDARAMETVATSVRGKPSEDRVLTLEAQQAGFSGQLVKAPVTLQSPESWPGFWG